MGSVQSRTSDGEVDALELADGCMTEWRDFMEGQGIVFRRAKRSAEDRKAEQLQ